MNATESRLLTTDELARRLHVGSAKIRDLARAGRIPSIRVGKALRFDWREVVTALRTKGNAEREEARSA